MTVEPVERGDALWDRLTEYADRCSWRAGPYLANMMRQGALTGWERVFAAAEVDDIAGFCTLTRTDCVPDVPYTPYIGFVFVGEPHRGGRLSERLIRRALRYAKELGFSKVYLTSREVSLYEKYGFVKLEDRKDQWGGDEQIFVISI
jgi:GNAT superfamily N-acetyltransferase